MSKEKYPDGEFYEKKFNCMVVLLANVIQVLAEPTEEEKEKIRDTLRTNSNFFSEKRKEDKNYFSIDEYIHKAFSKKRDSRGVMIFSGPPSKIQLAGHQS